MVAQSKRVRRIGFLAVAVWAVAGMLCEPAIVEAQVPVDLLAPPQEDVPVVSPFVEGTDGNLYGISSELSFNLDLGFGPGTIFRMTPGGALTVVRKFEVQDPVGGPPNSLVQAADGNFYGITGRNPNRFFRMSPGGGVEVLSEFSLANDVQPGAPLVQTPDGNFYFLATGLLVKLTPTGQQLPLPTLLTDITSLVSSLDGSLYMTGPFTSLAFGAVLNLTSSGTLTVVHAFAGGAEGGMPNRLVQAPDGTFYGTTSVGGTFGFGTIFRMTPTGEVTTLYSFMAPVNVTSLVSANGNVIGTTPDSLTGTREDLGTIFRLTPDGTLAMLRTGGVEGMSPGALMRAHDGTLYGNSGGDVGAGTMYRLAPDGTVTVLHRYWSTGGFQPVAVIQGRDGVFYGATRQLPFPPFDPRRGLLFRVASDGSFRVLHAFHGSDGADPNSLMQAADGTLFGTTTKGGTFDQGVVFRITGDGAFRVVHDFVYPDGAWPVAALIQTADGTLYGTTNGGGESGLGTVFRIGKAGEFAVVHHFAGGDHDGAYPTSPLIQATDGQFYGTSALGGSNGQGTIFRMTASGAVTVLQSLKNVDSIFSPVPGLTRGADGALYGATRAHVVSNPSSAPVQIHGTFFRLTLNGQFTVLREFELETDGSPESALLQTSDGNFYGVSDRSVFRVMADGTLAQLHSLCCGAGESGTSLIQATDGRLYGADPEALPSGEGAIFRVDPRAGFVPVVLFAAPGGAALKLTWSAVPGATSYTIRRSVAGGPLQLLASGIAATSFQDTTVPGGRLSTYVVTAVFANGRSYSSAEFAVPWRSPMSRTPTVTTVRDFDGDGKVDLTVYRRSTGGWFILRSLDGQVLNPEQGSPLQQDRPVPADYDGDGLADVAVYRQTTGEWIVRQSRDGVSWQLVWGASASGDLPVPADYDGDGRADVAVYRATTGEWFIRRSSDGTLVHMGWGSLADGDVPVPADYDGDGRADVAVYRITTGEWFILRSTSGALFHVAWGASSLGDVPTPGDFDGDGHTDIAVFRGTTGEWFIQRSSDGALVHFAWGAPQLGDVPVPGDYDGDGRTDVAVYRELTGEWFIRRSSDGGLTYWPFWGLPAMGDTVRPY